MIRRPPRSTQSRSSAASDVYKRQALEQTQELLKKMDEAGSQQKMQTIVDAAEKASEPVSYTHLRAHETPEHLVCRLLLEKKKKQHKFNNNNILHLNDTVLS